MSSFIVELAADHEEETISQSPPQIIAPPNSPNFLRHVPDQPMEETNQFEEELTNAITTNGQIITMPTFPVSIPFGEGPSTLPRPLLQDFLVPRYPSYNSTRFQHPRSTRPALRRRPLLVDPTILPRVSRTEEGITQLRSRIRILRTRVESQDTQIAALESEMEDANHRLYSLEAMVVDLQETVSRFETIFEGISRATTITSPSP